MRIAHSFLAILAGFITVMGIMGLADALLKRFAPEVAREDAPPDLFIMAVHVGIGLCAGLAGGYITARYTEGNPLVHALVLSIAVLLLSALSALQMKGKQPIYYLLILSIIPSLAVLAGGVLRLRQLGY